MNDLPPGFEALAPDKQAPKITFDTKYRRFFISAYIANNFGVPRKSRVGLAYNLQNKSILIDKKGYAFYVDARGYVTSREYADKVRNRLTPTDKPIVYVYDKEMSTDRFLIFNEV